MVNLLYIYPNFLTRPEQGAIVWVLSTANLFAPFINMGTTMTSVNFFQKFKDKLTSNNGFMGFLLGWVSLSYLLFLLLLFIFRSFIIDFYASKEFGMQFFLYTLPIAYAQALIGVIISYISNFKRIVVPSIINELSLKIFVPIFVLLFAFHFISFSQLFYFINGLYFLIVFGLLSYLKKINGLDLKINKKKFTPKLKKEITTYMGYAILGGISFTLVYNIDTFMLGMLLPEMALTGVAVYGFGAHISNVIDIPRKSITKIARPIIAESFENNDLKNIQTIYTKAAITQFLFGLFILMGVMICFDDLIQIMPNGNDFVNGKMIILLLGIGILVDLITSTNNEIIAYSKYYKFNFYATILLGILAVITNFMLIPRYLLLGATIATFGSKAFINIIKTIFVYSKFKMHPLSSNLIKIIGIGVLSYWIANHTLSFEKPFFDLLAKGSIFSIIYIILSIMFNISDDLNGILKKILNR